MYGPEGPPKDFLEQRLMEWFRVNILELPLVPMVKRRQALVIFQVQDELAARAAEERDDASGED